METLHQGFKIEELTGAATVAALDRDCSKFNFI